MSARLSAIEAAVAAVDAALEPITARPVTPAELSRMIERFRTEGGPLAMAGVEEQALAALRAVLGLYEHGPEDVRVAIRALFARHNSFRATVHLPWEATEESFRLRVPHWSARDLAGDARDELLTLRQWCAEAEVAGIDVAPVIRAVAAISSDTEKWAMGSTRGLLLGLAS